eukprot:gnl/TRDRNA2_/TRDRNA2_175071_c12_seq6.p1 gnl/TRDRNA2_/TRDRNA2_175071_c12~~gnl/TRDRNA2_/TRDRNA2_175071_c12_seq6.p1  ORF type:complete len:101 (+),score=12.22 gnl/TRDRNA2_/TRDRNA2_175071_c12_seq6:76-378(+)
MSTIHRCKCPRRVCQPLSAALTHQLHRYTGQRRKQPPTRLAELRKSSCGVRDVLRIELTQPALRRSGQLLILQLDRGEGPDGVGELLRLELAQLQLRRPR